MQYPELNRIRIRQALTLGILGLVVMCIVPVPTWWGHWLPQRALPVALTLLVFGVLCAFLHQTRLMLVLLGGSFAIAFNQHVILGDQPGGLGEVSLTVGFLHKDAQIEPASMSDVRGLPQILLTDTSAPIAAFSAHYPFCAFLPSDREGSSHFLLSRLPITRQEHVLLQENMPALALRVYLENNQRLFTWVICPVDSFYASNGSKFPVKQPFILFTNGIKEMPRSLLQMESCPIGSVPLLVSFHFCCQKTAPIVIGADTVGISGSLRLSNSYVYAD